MKKFNLLLLTALVAFGSVFTSCKDDDTEVLEITLENATLDKGTSLNGEITSTAGLESVQIFIVTAAGKQSLKLITDFDILPVLENPINDKYTILIPKELIAVDGSYEIEAIDKDGLKATKNFTVGAGTPGGVITELNSSVTIYCTVGDGGSASTCASADGSTYNPATATVAEQAKVDFIFFNGNGTAAYGPAGQVFGPLSYPSGLAATFSSWTNFNDTKIGKSTSITYASATYAEVAAELLTTSTYSVSLLAVGDVVVFETEAGKVGVFKVNSITSGVLGTDNINISIKVQS